MFRMPTNSWTQIWLEYSQCGEGYAHGNSLAFVIAGKYKQTILLQEVLIEGLRQRDEIVVDAISKELTGLLQLQRAIGLPEIEDQVVGSCLDFQMIQLK